MGVIKRIYNFKEIIEKHCFKDVMSFTDNDFCYGYYSSTNDMEGIVIYRDNVSVYQIIFIYVIPLKRNCGIGELLLNEIKIISKKKSIPLCCKFTSNDVLMTEIFGFFFKNGFKSPKIIRRNGIIDCQLYKDIFINKRNIQENEILNGIKGHIIHADLLCDKHDLIEYLSEMQEIYDYTHLLKDKKTLISFALIIEDVLISWVFLKEISSRVMNVEYLYCKDEYRKKTLGFISFHFFFNLFVEKYNYQYLSFTTMKEDDRLLGCYKLLFKKSLFRIVDTKISFYSPNDEKEI